MLDFSLYCSGAVTIQHWTEGLSTADLHLDLTYPPRPAAGSMNALGRFLLGLAHENAHLPQMREVICQARAAA